MSRPSSPALRSGAPLTAIFAGTFDPVTLGHLDVMRRGAAVFGRLLRGHEDRSNDSEHRPELGRQKRGFCLLACHRRPGRPLRRLETAFVGRGFTCCHVDPSLLCPACMSR